MTDKNVYKAMFTEYPDVLNVVEMSQALNISIKTTYKLLNKKVIGYLKIGREYRIPKINLINYLLSSG